MRIIKDNMNKYPIQVTCVNCESVIELEDGKDVLCFRLAGDDMNMFVTSNYAKVWKCPLCNTNNKL